MKKISFGSFPLTEIRAEDRRCLDRYLIKTFADNISISDAIRNLAVTKNLMYITPDALMEYWLNNKGGFKNNTVSMNDRTSNNLYDQALKRAFYILKEFYKKIMHAPFYKEYIYYPIYVEKIEKIGVGGNIERDRQYTDVQMNYSFVILSNDLTKGLKVDEIKYDENASLNFLFLFIEFFSSPDALGGSIHDFGSKDYEFLIKLYQFVEASGKDPIHMTIDLYKLLGLIKRATGDLKTGSTNPFSYDVKKGIEGLDNKMLKKYRGMLRHKILELAKKTKTSTSDKKLYKQAFIDIMDSIFKSEGLSGLYDGVDSGADMNQRLQYVYHSNKYREILNLAKELVEYNKLDCSDVITKDPMDFDFSVESGNFKIDTQRHVLAQKYQTFFKVYVESISLYIKGIVGSLINEFNIDKAIRNREKGKAESTDRLIRDKERELTGAKKVLERLQNKEAFLRDQLQAAENINNGDLTSQYSKELGNLMSGPLSAADNKVARLQKEVEQLKTTADVLDGYNSKISIAFKTASQKMVDDVSKAVISSIANDLTFVYDDGKSFFTDDLIAEGFLKLTKSSEYDFTEPSKFDNVLKDISKFKPTIEKDSGIKEPNPEYYAAQLIRSLDNAFDVLASDTITALSDVLKPSIHRTLRENGTGENKDFDEYLNEILTDLFSNLYDTNTGMFFSKSKKEPFQKNLKIEIYRNRFLKHVLAKFKSYFNMHKVTKRIDYDENVSQLHPLIAKLIRQGRKCQYFKSFIINYDTCEQLYRLKFILDTQKFLAGIDNQPPRKLNSPMHKLQTVLYDYLGLKNNPVWIISRQNVYLSMPDDLSLTNTSILSKIPKTELMQVCKIKASDYWNENTMGRVAQLGNKELARIYDRIDKLREQINDKQKEIRELDSGDKGYKNRKTSLEKDIRGLNKKIDDLEEKANKLKLETKQYKPNAFLFAEEEDDPNKAENEELLSPAELADLNRKKEEMQNKLLNLNPYDDSELEELKKQQEKIERSHPMDFEEEEPEPEPKETELEKLLRLRKEAEEERKRDGRF